MVLGEGAPPFLQQPGVPLNRSQRLWMRKKEEVVVEVAGEVEIHLREQEVSAEEGRPELLRLEVEGDRSEFLRRWLEEGQPELLRWGVEEGQSKVSRTEVEEGQSGLSRPEVEEDQSELSRPEVEGVLGVQEEVEVGEGHRWHSQQEGEEFQGLKVLEVQEVVVELGQRELLQRGTKGFH